MKVISKVISKNEFVSRRNGVVPSLVDVWKLPKMYINCNGDEISGYTFYSYETAVEKARELGLSPSILEHDSIFIYQDHNYGLVVSDVIIPNYVVLKNNDGTERTTSIKSNVTDYTDIYINIPDNNGGYYDLNDNSSHVHYDGRKIISGGTEVKILTYSTLNKWYIFLKGYKERFSKYYYEPYENSAIRYYAAEYEPKNDSNRKEFEDLDALFKARGGNDMYDWITQYCMPHDCKYTVKNYFDFATNSASYSIPILITASIDDLGQMSILSNKWKDGVNYGNTIDDFKNGTVIDRPYYKKDDYVITEYETYSVSGSYKTYKQNEFFENEFQPNECSNYTDFYISNNSKEFETNGINGMPITGYAYSPIDGRVIYLEMGSNKKTDDEIIKYDSNRFVLIDGEYVKVLNDGYYVEPNISDWYVANISVRNGNKLPVFEDGSLKYAELNGKKFYALKDDDNTEKIYFTNINHYHDNGSIVKKGDYILYNNMLYILNGSTISINDEKNNKTIYHCLDGYFDYNGTTYYISNNNVVIQKINKTYTQDKRWTIEYYYERISDEDLKYLGWDSVYVDRGNVIIKHKLDIKRADAVTGYSDSKLDLLRRKKVNTDDLGNELPGYLELETDSGGTHYNTTYNECTLDILYKVGETSELSRQKTLGDNTELFNGNYLESIKFYHKNEEDEFVFIEGDDSRDYLNLFFEEPDYDENGDIIETPLYNSEGNEIGYKGQFYRPGELLYCDITYYINATLVYDTDNYRYILSEGRHKGVKYIDTAVVTKTNGDFYMSDGSKFTFNYYELKNSMSNEKLDDFKDEQLTNMAYFEMNILNRYYETNEFEWNGENSYWERYNNMISTPVFRTEYDLWSSTPQNLKSDIYIDRGINAAFEKHLKLEEVHTMDALENYGNSYFKINEY